MTSVTLLLLMCWLPFFDCAQVSTNVFGNRVTKGKVTEHDLNHITGGALSRVHKDLMWMVGNAKNELYAVDINTGKMIGSFPVSGAPKWDWEDLAYGPCMDDCTNNRCGAGKPVARYCIYVADIGGHGGSGGHAKNIIYMVREPDDLGVKDGTILMVSYPLPVVDQLEFTWSERDAETLMISPDARLFIISKTSTGHSLMAEIPGVVPAWGSHGVNLDLENNVRLNLSTTHHDPMGGAISPGGTEMILTCQDDVFYYSITDGDYINAVRTQPPQHVSSYVSHKNTEAITWDPQAKGFYLYASGSNEHIYYYPRAANGPVVG